MNHKRQIKQGIRANANQFFLLVLTNALVGGMLGMERTVVPVMAQQSFELHHRTTILSFIMVFGLSKAVSNYLAGGYSGRWGRKRLLVLGWLFGLPVPLLLMWAPSWGWVLVANALLGIHQGFAWSSTVIMKIDLAGPGQRGLATGINEFAGYIAIGLTAYWTGLLADVHGIRPYPFYVGLGLAIAGLALSLFLVRDTSHFLSLESDTAPRRGMPATIPDTARTNQVLWTVTQAGFINNLNDGVIWGLLPIFLLRQELTLERIGLVVALYPAVWGFGQLFAGRLGDLLSIKALLVGGMLIQAVALFGFTQTSQWPGLLTASAALGFGTALVYPNFLTAIANVLKPHRRSAGIGIFRFWRDLGYAAGALLAGVMADRFNPAASLTGIAALTLLSALILKWYFPPRI